jgi:hypothetical protein
MMIEMDMMTTEQKYDEAFSLIDEIISLSDGDDVIPHVLKANTLFQKVVTRFRLWIDRTTTTPQALLHFQFAEQSNSQADSMEAQSLLKVREHSLPLFHPLTPRLASSGHL